MIRALSVSLAGWPLYLALAIVTTWPLATQLDEQLVLGTEVSRTVPQFNAWTLWWNVDRVAHGFRGYWDAPIFHPTVNTFALSEPQPITTLMAPVFWLTGSVLATTNLYLLLTLLLNGWLAERCALRFGMRRSLAVGAGAAVVLLPIVHWQMGVLQLVGLWPSLWTLLEFERTFGTTPSPANSRRGQWWRGARLGIAYSAALWTCVHHALFLGLLLLLCAPARLRRIASGPGRRGVTAALLSCALLSGWLLLRLWQMPVEKPRRPVELITQLSLVPADFLAVYGHTWLEAGERWTRAGWFLSPGTLKVLLAVVGLVWGLASRPRRGATIWLACLLTVSLLLSFGTRLELWGWQPWLSIAAWVPGFGQVRNVFRFAYFSQLITVLLAALGVEATWSWLRSPGSSPPATQHASSGASASSPRDDSGRIGDRAVARWRTVAASILVLLGAIAVFDPWPPRLQLTLPGPLALPPAGPTHWTSVLRRDAALWNQTTSPRRRAVVCLPMASGNDVRDFAISTDWMLAGARHQLPMVNGYSGFFPPNFFYWRDRLQSAEPIDATVLANLYRSGVRWLVIDPQNYPVDDAETFRLGSYALTRISSADEPIRVYRLTVHQ